jgi:hypothetical protein
MHSERLVKAVDADEVPAVEAALAAGDDVNARLGGGGTLLMRAASEGHLAMLQALLRGGADVDAKRDDGMTALMLASFFGHIHVASALLDWGADINAEDTHKFTALRLASSRGHVEVKKLFEQAAATRPATAHGRAAQESLALPRAQTEQARGAGEQEGQDRKVIVSTWLPVDVTTPEEGARRPEPCVEESAPPPLELSPPLSEVISPARAGGAKLLAVGACVVLLFVGFQRTLVRSSGGDAARPATPPAIDVGAQPVTPLAPPQGREETAAGSAAAATPTPPQRDRTAGNTDKGEAAAGPVEPPPAPAAEQHPAEPAVVSTAHTSVPPPQTNSRPPAVKEAGALTPTEKTPAVIVVATPRDVPRSGPRHGEPPPAVAPPLSSPTPKKKVIPWP